jgi:hypothetical protein
MALVAQRPSQDLINLVGTLGGTWHGRTAMCRCPAHADARPSLSLRQGDRGILVTCFAGCHREDVLRELSRIRTDKHYRYVDTGSNRHGNLDQLWSEALPTAGTLAERYLASRNLMPHGDDLRFHPRCPFLPRPRTRYLPALLVAVRQDRDIVAIQRIFLDPSTARCTFKAMLGRPMAGAWKGRVPADRLAIAEGFETAQAFDLIHDIPTWASLGTRRLPLLRLPEQITALIIAEDNDAGGRQAAIAAEAAYARNDLRIVRAPPPQRFNDWCAVREAMLATSA